MRAQPVPLRPAQSTIAHAYIMGLTDGNANPHPSAHRALSCRGRYARDVAVTCTTWWSQARLEASRLRDTTDITATPLTEVCLGVMTEPHLQPLSGESLSTAQPSLTMVLDWMLQCTDSGEEDLKRHLLM